MRTEYTKETAQAQIESLGRLCSPRLVRLLHLLESFAVGPDAVISNEDGSADALGLAITAIRDASKGDIDRSEAADAVAEFIRTQGCPDPDRKVAAIMGNRSARELVTCEVD